MHALYGQRGAYTPEYRHKYRFLRSGAPSHVPWTGGIVGGPPVDLTVAWTTGIEGMKSSTGDELTVRAQIGQKPRYCLKPYGVYQRAGCVTELAGMGSTWRIRETP